MRPRLAPGAPPSRNARLVLFCPTTSGQRRSHAILDAARRLLGEWPRTTPSVERGPSAPNSFFSAKRKVEYPAPTVAPSAARSAPALRAGRGPRPNPAGAGGFPAGGGGRWNYWHGTRAAELSSVRKPGSELERGLERGLNRQNPKQQQRQATASKRRAAEQNSSSRSSSNNQRHKPGSRWPRRRASS